MLAGYGGWRGSSLGWRWLLGCTCDEKAQRCGGKAAHCFHALVPQLRPLSNCAARFKHGDGTARPPWDALLRPWMLCFGLGVRLCCAQRCRGTVKAAGVVESFLQCLSSTCGVR
eukprot:379775-Rhodomonas_salina.1